MGSPDTSVASTSSAAIVKGKDKGKVQVKAGSNWKKLHKSLRNDQPSDTKKRQWLHSNGKRKDNGSALKASESDSRTSSPAPTTLPWFAEDLSPEDLALVRMNSGQASGSTSSKGDTNGKEASDTLSKDEQEAARRRIILGGEGLSQGKAEAGTYIAMDCEMVGVGPNGSESVLARCSIVNWHGAVLLDTFVRPQEKVTDYRTWVSGVRAKDLKGAPQFAEVQEKVANLIKGRILVGHALHNDLNALLLSHPKNMTRDTASYEGSRKIANTKYPSLRKLVELKLGLIIQKSGSEHSSVEDARATMALYRSFHAEWQQTLNGAGTAGRKRKSSTSSNTQIIGKGWKKAKDDSGSSGNSVRKSSKSAAPDDPEWWNKL
ncbi:uncharacterized protein FA14DRAFT_145784 [Meira miltonrushii]|uniref:RNA exonuclease 4 n=1 Tax=Meira miltonrushii TaxID=1280837 RepID=A0A316VDZ4_9BASI|nr:uncharacterized protein FA14DRAFT_145784 [Meira miltonrushii]PWN35792.1 hypothetical protein FA14DRAFT_145784 [Meira miltonrushii]